MLLLMRYNGVPKLAREKIASSLVTSMIGEYLKATTTASSLKLASFIGFPPSMEKEVERTRGQFSSLGIKEGDKKMLPKRGIRSLNNWVRDCIFE